jgi:ubiquinone/menaquinone biosynthesis C-methylase UbiE
LKRKKFKGRKYNGVLKSTRAYYERFSEGYVRFYENWLKGEGEFSNLGYKEGYDRVADILSETATPGERVIDIGCGVGIWSTLLAEKGVHIASLDNLPGVIRKSAERSKAFKLKSKISPFLSDGFHLPFRNEVFDGATLNWVLAHIPVTGNAEFMNEVSRVVRRRGWLFISDSYWREQDGGKEQVQVRETEGRECVVYKYYYDQNELKQLIEKTLGEVEFMRPLRYELICIAKKK